MSIKQNKYKSKHFRRNKKKTFELQPVENTNAFKRPCPSFKGEPRLNHYIKMIFYTKCQLI